MAAVSISGRRTHKDYSAESDISVIFYISCISDISDIFGRRKGFDKLSVGCTSGILDLYNISDIFTFFFQRRNTFDKFSGDCTSGISSGTLPIQERPRMLTKEKGYLATQAVFVTFFEHKTCET